MALVVNEVEGPTYDGFVSGRSFHPDGTAESLGWRGRELLRVTVAGSEGED